MFEAAILICRYFFVFYMLYFLLQGAKVILTQRGVYDFNIPIAFSKQRLTIIFFHLTAILVVAFQSDKGFFDVKRLILGGIGLVFLIGANYVLSIIYRESSKLMWNSVFFLMDISFIMLMRLNQSLAQKQLVWFLVGFLVTMSIPFVLNFLPRLDKLKYFYLIFGLALLVATLLFGNEEGGAQNWLTIGKFSFQPAEIVKMLFVFYLASSFEKGMTFKQLIFPTVMSAIFVLCLVLQTDLGSALIFFMSFVVMIYIATGNALIFGSCMLCAGFGSVIAYRLFSHVRTRVQVWLNPWADIDGKGYQITQSLFAIGTWGIFGSGLTKGYAKSIPVVERDFIFSAIAEEFGIIFAIGLIVVFIFIFFCGAKASLRNYNRFLSLVASGLTGLLCFQSFLIIGGVTKFIPMTGVTLPFISYGGTSIVISFATIGIIQWIYAMNRTRENQRK